MELEGHYRKERRDQALVHFGLHHLRAIQRLLLVALQELPLEVQFEVFEQVILSGDLAVPLEVVHRLSHVVPESLEVHLLRNWSPPKMEVTLLQVLGWHPQLCSEWTAFFQHALDQLAVVAGEDLVLQLACFRPRHLDHALLLPLRERQLGSEVHGVWNFPALILGGAYGFHNDVSLFLPELLQVLVHLAILRQQKSLSLTSTSIESFSQLGVLAALFLFLGRFLILITQMFLAEGLDFLLVLGV